MQWSQLPSRRRRAIAARVFAEQGRNCALQLPGCTGYATEPDHVIPSSAGGSHDPSNLRPSCRHCNATRGAEPLPRPAVTLAPSRDWWT